MNEPHPRTVHAHKISTAESGIASSALQRSKELVLIYDGNKTRNFTLLMAAIERIALNPNSQQTTRRGTKKKNKCVPFALWTLFIHFQMLVLWTRQRQVWATDIVNSNEWLSVLLRRGACKWINEISSVHPLATRCNRHQWQHGETPVYLLHPWNVRPPTSSRIAGARWDFRNFTLNYRL